VRLPKNRTHQTENHLIGFDAKNIEELNKQIIKTTLINDPISFDEEKNIKQSASLEDISA
jgi:hypothetical protein